MRLPLVFGLFLLLQASSASGADLIKPGINLDTAIKFLQSHGYDVNLEKYQLAIISEDKNIDLDFCRIDDEITLVLAFDKSTMQIASLSVYIFPEHRTSKLQTVVREVRELQLEEDGVYSLKLKRANNALKAE